MTRGILALDVGGANVKLAHSAGVVRSSPFALWREPERLSRVLRRLAEGLPDFGRVVFTTTAELCDCFETKREGVLSVLAAVESAYAEIPIAVWGTDGRIHEPDAIRAAPHLAAAANWLALAEAAARLVGEGCALLIDVGSTTTDLIPIADGNVVAEGRDDTGRLRSGELVYAGVKRTPLCAVADSLPFRGRATRLCAELFATTQDVFLTLGDLPPDPEDRATADGRPATAEFALNRLARMVGADREGMSAGDAHALASAASEALMLRLTEAAFQSCRGLGGRPACVVVAGSGEFLAARLAGRILVPGGRILSLAAFWGAAASGAACARALLELASDPTGVVGP